MTNQPAPDATWGALNEMDGDARVQEMRTRSEALADLDEAARGQQAQSMILSEYQLDDSTLQDFTESRLRAWIAVAGDDLSRAQSVATAYDKAFERVSGQIAMRRSAIVQTVARNRFTPEDIDVLYELMPKQVANIRVRARKQSSTRWRPSARRTPRCRPPPVAPASPGGSSGSASRLGARALPARLRPRRARRSRAVRRCCALRRRAVGPSPLLSERVS